MPSAREWRNASLLGTLMLGGGLGGAAYAEQTIASGLVVVFVAVIPLVMIAINLVFRIFPRRSELLAVLVGLSGVIMLTQGTAFHGSPGGLAALILGALCWALGSVLSQRGFTLAPGATGFATELLCGGLALLIMSALSGESWYWPNQWRPWLAWSYLVTFGSLIAFNAYMVLLARTPVTLAASYTFVNPVVALFLGVALGGETISKWEWAASGIVLSGIALLFMGRRRC